MIERVHWSLESLRVLNTMESLRFSVDETLEYRRKLMRDIERKVILLGASIPSKEEQYQGTYRIMIDRYKAYYALSNDGTIAYIETIAHMHMQ